MQPLCLRATQVPGSGQAVALVSAGRAREAARVTLTSTNPRDERRRTPKSARSGLFGARGRGGPAKTSNLPVLDVNTTMRCYLLLGTAGYIMSCII